MNTQLETLKAEAHETLAAYPQYDGYFDDAVLVTVTSEVKTKMGVAFTAGEVSIAARNQYVEDETDFVTVWSRSNRVNTSVPARKVVFNEDASVDIEVGRFTYHADSGAISGPRDYVEDGHVKRVIDEVAAGKRASFNANPSALTHPIRSLLVTIQTDYAAYAGHAGLFGRPGKDWR